MARITKILEGTLSTGNTTVSFTDSDIPNSLIRVYATNAEVFPSSITLSGNTLTITYQAQTSTLYIAVELVKAGLEVVDNVTSDDADAALSAKQGKYLKGLIDAITVDVAADDVSYDNTTTGMDATNVQDAIDEVFQSVSNGKELIADAITDKGVQTSASDTFATMAENIAAIPSGGGSGEVVISYYSGYSSTTAEKAQTYTASKSGTLFVGAIHTIDSYMQSEAKPKAYLNNVEQTASSSGGGLWTWQWNTASYYATFSIDVVAGDVVKITGSPSTSSATGKSTFIYAVLV